MRGETTSATNLATGRSAEVDCVDLSGISAPLHLLPTQGAFAIALRHIVIDAETMEVHCFPFDEDMPAGVDDVSAGGRVVHASAPRTTDGGGTVVVATLDGEILWASAPLEEPNTTVNAMRFVDEDTLAITTTQVNEVTTRLQDIDAD